MATIPKEHKHRFDKIMKSCENRPMEPEELKFLLGFLDEQELGLMLDVAKNITSKNTLH